MLDIGIGSHARPIVDIVRRILDFTPLRDKLCKADLDSCFKYAMSCFSDASYIGLKPHANIVANVLLALKFDGVTESTNRSAMLQKFGNYFQNPASTDGVANTELFTAMTHFALDCAPNDLKGTFELCCKVIPTLLEMWQGSQIRQAPDLDIGVVFLLLSLHVANALCLCNPDSVKPYDSIVQNMIAYFEERVIRKQDRSFALDPRHLVLDGFCMRVVDPIPFGKYIKPSDDMKATFIHSWRTYTLLAHCLLYHIKSSNDFAVYWEDWAGNSNHHVPALITLSMMHRLGMPFKMSTEVIDTMVQFVGQNGSMEVQIWAAIALACHVRGNVAEYDWNPVANSCVAGLMVAHKAAPMAALLCAILEHVQLDSLHRLATSSLEVRVPSSPVECHAALLQIRASLVAACLHALDRQFPLPTELIRTLVSVFFEDLRHVLHSNTEEKSFLLDDVNLLSLASLLGGTWPSNQLILSYGQNIYSSYAGWEFRLRDLQDSLADPMVARNAPVNQKAASAAGFSHMMTKISKDVCKTLERTLDATQLTSPREESIESVDFALRLARLQVETLCGLSTFLEVQFSDRLNRARELVSLQVDKALRLFRDALGGSSERSFQAVLLLSRLLAATRLPRIYQLSQEQTTHESLYDETLTSVVSRVGLQDLVARITAFLNAVGKRKRSDSDEYEAIRSFSLVQDFYSTGTRNVGKMSIQISMIQILSKCVTLLTMPCRNPPIDWNHQWVDNALAPVFKENDVVPCNAEMLTYFEACLSSPIRLDWRWKELEASGSAFATNPFISAIIIRVGSLMLTLPNADEDLFRHAWNLMQFMVHSAKKDLIGWRVQVELYPLISALYIATLSMEDLAVDLEHLINGPSHPSKIVRQAAIHQVLHMFDALVQRKLDPTMITQMVMDQLQQLANINQIDYAPTSCFLATELGSRHRALLPSVVIRMFQVAKHQRPESEIIVKRSFQYMARKIGYPNVGAFLDDVAIGVIEQWMESCLQLSSFPAFMFELEPVQFFEKYANVLVPRLHVRTRREDLAYMAQEMKLSKTALLQKTFASNVALVVVDLTARGSNDSFSFALQNLLAPGSTLDLVLDLECLQNVIFEMLLLTEGTCAKTLVAKVFKDTYRQRAILQIFPSTQNAPREVTIRKPLFAPLVIFEAIKTIISIARDDLDAVFTAQFSLTLIEKVALLSESSVLQSEAERFADVIGMILVLRGELNDDVLFYGSTVNILTRLCSRGFTPVRGLMLLMPHFNHIWCPAVLAVAMQWINAQNGSRSGRALESFLKKVMESPVDWHQETAIQLRALFEMHSDLPVANELAKKLESQHKFQGLIPKRDVRDFSVVAAVGCRQLTKHVQDAQIWNNLQDEKPEAFGDMLDICMDPLMPNNVGIASTRALASVFPAVQEYRRPVKLSSALKTPDDKRCHVYAVAVHHLTELTMNGTIQVATLARKSLFYLFGIEFARRNVSKIVKYADELGWNKLAKQHFDENSPIQQLPKKVPCEIPSSIGIPHDEWLCKTARVLSSSLGNALGATLFPLLERQARFAEHMIPYLLLLLDLDGKHAGGNAVASFVADWENQTVASLSVWIETILILRQIKLEEKGKYFFAANCVFLNLDYDVFARAAIKTKMFSTALMFLEIAIEARGRLTAWQQYSRSQLPPKYVDLLQQVYIDLDPSNYDVLHAGQSMADLAVKFRREGDFPSLILLQESTSESHPTQIAEALSGLGYYNTLEGFVTGENATMGMTDLHYEAAWRNAQWDLDIPPATATGNHSTIFSLMKSLHDGDGSRLEYLLGEAYNQVHSQLLALGPDATQGREDLYGKALSVREIEEAATMVHALQLRVMDSPFQSKQHATADTVKELWMTRLPRLRKAWSNDSLHCVMGVRCSVLGIVEERLDLNSTWRVEAMLDWARSERKEGQSAKAYRILQDANKIPGISLDLGAKLTVEQAKTLWSLGQRNIAIQLLKSRLPPPKDSDNACMRSLLGSYIAQDRHESPEDVIRNYLLPATMVGSLEKKARAHHVLAQYADSRIQQAMEDFDEATQLNELKQSEANMASNITRTDRVFVQLKEGEERVKKLDSLKTRYINLAVIHYLEGLQNGSGDGVDKYRFFALWMQHSPTEKELDDAVSVCLEKVNTAVFVDMIRHFCSILSEEPTKFNIILKKFMQRMAKEHPYHTIPHWYSMLEYENGQQVKNDPKARVFHEMFHELVRTRVKGLVTEYNWFTRHAAEFGNAVLPPAIASSRGDYTPPNHPIFAAAEKCPHLPIFTLNLPVRSDGDYTRDLVTMTSVEETVKILDGLSAPKLVTFKGSDGKEYKMIFKGRDDMRQDALLQSLLTITSSLLRRNRLTKNLEPRTYSVMILPGVHSQNAILRSGVIEFVSGTESLLEACRFDNSAEKSHQYAFQSHARLLEAFANESIDQGAMRDKFLDICAKVRPGLRNYLEWRASSPQVAYENRRTFTQSAASMSIIGWIVGLGDRHGSNIRLDMNTGQVVHIDFGHALESSRYMNVPETIPFRLTQNMEDAMGPLGKDGEFRSTCERVLTALRDLEAATMITRVLDVLRLDPVGVAKARITQKDLKQSQDMEPEIIAQRKHDIQVLDQVKGDVEAHRVMTIIKRKLSNAGDSVTSTVNDLIRDATDPMLLMKLFPGWRPWA
jgi:hypothetical protein